MCSQSVCLRERDEKKVLKVVCFSVVCLCVCQSVCESMCSVSVVCARERGQKGQQLNKLLLSVCACSKWCVSLSFFAWLVGHMNTSKQQSDANRRHRHTTHTPLYNTSTTLPNTHTPTLQHYTDLRAVRGTKLLPASTVADRDCYCSLQHTHTATRQPYPPSCEFS